MCCSDYLVGGGFIILVHKIIFRKTRLFHVEQTIGDGRTGATFYLSSFFALIHSEAAGAVLGWSDKMRAKKEKDRAHVTLEYSSFYACALSCV